MSLPEKINLYTDIYSQLYSELKWKTDKRALMLIAAMYVTNSKEFNLSEFLELTDYIKNEVSIFSHLKTAQRYTTAATLHTATANPRKSFQDFTAIYEKLIEVGFGRNVFSYIAAGALLKTDQKRTDEYVKKSMEIYKSMRKEHFFLTTPCDYPFATILSLCEKQTEDIIAMTEEYYQRLQEVGFSIGNDLQFLTHILTLDNDHRPEEKSVHCLQVKNLLNQAGFPTKRVYYPYIGLLTFLEKPEDEIENLLVMNEMLNNEKLFKWNKDINFMMSVLFVLSEKTGINDAATTGLKTTIETIIQAQQAAMTASITAASSSSSN